MLSHRSLWIVIVIAFVAGAAAYFAGLYYEGMSQNFFDAMVATVGAVVLVAAVGFGIALAVFVE